MGKSEKYILMAVYNQLEKDGRSLRQAETLVNAGYRVVVLSANTSYKTDFFQVHSYRVRRGAMGWILFCIYAFCFICKHRSDIAFLYLQNHYLTGLGYISCKILKKKWVYDAHENLIPAKRYGMKTEKFLLYMERISIRSASLVVAANYERARILKSIYGLKNVIFVRNIIHTEQIKKKRAYIRPKPDDDFWLLYQGYLGEERNLQLFIRALAELPHRFKLRIIGGGEQLDYLYFLVKELHLGERVEFLGHLPYEEMLSKSIGVDLGIVYYKSWNLNTYYCSPNKIYEYSNMNIPVLSSGQPMFKDIFKKYKIGEYLVDNVTPKDVACVIKKISDSYELYLSNFERFNAEYNAKNDERCLLNALEHIFVY